MFGETMELKYLVTFKTILQCGSFLEAAQKLNYTQSTITFQMQQLERELHVQLFEKIGRKMAVTQAGRELAPYVDEVLQSVERLSNYGKEYAALSGTLQVAAAETLLTYQMQPILKRFREQAPGVKLSIRCENCYRIRDEVLRGGVDIGVHYDVGGYGGSMTVQPLAEFPITLVAAPQRQWSGLAFGTDSRQPIPLITNDRNGIYQRIMERWLSRRRIVLENVIELGNTETVKSCVAGDLGIALLPRFAVERQLADGTLQAVESDFSRESITAVCSYHKNKWVTPAMELFMELTREHFAALRQPEGQQAKYA